MDEAPYRQQAEPCGGPRRLKVLQIERKHGRVDGGTFLLLLSRALAHFGALGTCEVRRKGQLAASMAPRLPPCGVTAEQPCPSRASTSPTGTAP